MHPVGAPVDELTGIRILRNTVVNSSRVISHSCGLSLDRATAKVWTGTSVTLKWLPL